MVASSAARAGEDAAAEPHQASLRGGRLSVGSFDSLAITRTRRISSFGELSQQIRGRLRLSWVAWFGGEQPACTYRAAYRLDGAERLFQNMAEQLEVGPRNHDWFGQAR